VTRETAPITTLGPHFAEAVQWASALHRDQARKSTRIPYVSHLFSVAALVLEGGGSETEAIAAALHDSIEDLGVTREEIARFFGNEVGDIVDGCTDEIDAGAPRDASNWHARKEWYLAHLDDPDTSESVLRVSAADKVHNARSIVSELRRGEDVWNRFNAGADDQLWYYRKLVEVFERRLGGVLTEELRAAVSEMERLSLDTPAEGERTDVLFDQSGLRIKRIVSSAHPEDVVFDQDHDEWFIVLSGDASLDVAGTQVDLVAGDHLFIPAHQQHRVIRTAHGTEWLAVYAT
jgi:mannose-6-phosphate isomerase-like protein (cupin superfamily)